MATNEKKRKRGEEFAEKYYTIVKDYEKIKINHPRLKEDRGCDLKMKTPTGNILRIEVKTSSNKKCGIPDFHENEFEITDINGETDCKFKPDILCVIRLDDGLRIERIEELTREEINKYSKNHEVIKRVRTKLLDKELYDYISGRGNKLGTIVTKEELKKFGLPVNNELI